MSTRWRSCTSRMKITPQNKKIKKHTDSTAAYTLSSHSITGPAVIVVWTPAQHPMLVISVNEAEHIY